MSKKPRALNKAVISVTFPDGCRSRLETRPDADIATDVVAFAKWLAKVAEEMLEAATKEGLHKVADVETQP